MMKLVLLLLVCAAASWPAQAAQTKEFDLARLSDAGRPAYQALLHTDWFSIGGIGFTGQIAPEEKAFRTLAQEKHADKAFDSLLTRAEGGGRLYALLWLSFTNKDAFARELKDYRASEAARQEVRSAQGCFLYSKRGEEVAALIEAGQYSMYAEELMRPSDTH